MKQQRFLQGAAVLALGTLLVKILGAIFKIPVNRMLGPRGFGHFQVAYSIFALLLTVSTAGLPAALSRLIARAEALGDRSGLQRIFRTGLRVFLSLGALSSLGMLLYARPLAAFMRDPGAAPAMAVLAPSVVFLCLCSAIRGYFQGRRYMTPTAVSQVIEALSKLILGLGAVAVLLRRGCGPETAAAGAISGVTAGAVLAAGYLLLQYRRRRIRLLPEEVSLSGPGEGEILRELLRLAVPITLGAAGLQLIYALDGKLLLGRLQDAFGLSPGEAAARYGIFAGAAAFYMLPGGLITPLAVSLIPSVTEAVTRGRSRRAGEIGETAIYLTLLLSLPCGAGLTALAGPIQRAAYGYSPETLALAGPVLGVLGAAAPLSCLGAVTGALLQAHGHPAAPIRSMALGGLVNLALTWRLGGHPALGLLGGALGYLGGGLVIALGNLLQLRRLTPLPPALGRRVPGLLLAAGLTGLGAFLTERLCLGAAGPLAALAAGVLAGAAVYGCLLYGLGLVSREDLAEMRKPRPAPARGMDI